MNCLLALLAGPATCVSTPACRWRNDKFFYSFNALPELLVLCLQLPFFMLARIGQAWPKPTGQSKDEEGSEQEHEGQCDTEMSQRP